MNLDIEEVKLGTTDGTKIKIKRESGEGKINALKFIFYNENGEPVENRNNIHRYEWSTLDNGLIRELRYNLAEESTVMNPFCPFYELRFKYDNEGFVVAMMNYEADTLYNCTAENCGDIGVSYFEFINSDNGDLLIESSLGCHLADCAGLA